MADPNKLATALAAALLPSMVAMATTIAEALWPPLDPAAVYQRRRGPGANDAGGAVAAVAASAIAPSTKRRRSWSLPRNYQMTPPTYHGGAANLRARPSGVGPETAAGCGVHGARVVPQTGQPIHCASASHPATGGHVVQCTAHSVQHLEQLRLVEVGERPRGGGPLV